MDKDWLSCTQSTERIPGVLRDVTPNALSTLLAQEEGVLVPHEGVLKEADGVKRGGDWALEIPEPIVLPGSFE
eukprot:XP_001709993.1 Hypothetical protein GL50803_31953 [Giardia lamblia ATCC 50803]